MSNSLIRKAVKLAKKFGFVESKQVKHGTRYYNTKGAYVQISSSPRTEAFYNGVKQDIAKHLGVSKSTIS